MVVLFEIAAIESISYTAFEILISGFLIVGDRVGRDVKRRSVSKGGEAEVRLEASS
jgi:hypothetical protein|tara:strand:- start:3028 stop:3195 length:168 start_codon:yes stop_codon:yes gene_type:complete